MPPVQPHRRRRSRFGLLAMALVSLVAVGGGLVMTLWALDVPHAFWHEESHETNPYLVRIPVNVREISAYSRVSRTDLIDATDRRIRYQELPPGAAINMAIAGISEEGAAVEGKVVDIHKHHGQLLFVLDSGEEIPHHQVDQLGGALMNVSAIVGRVLRKDKSPGLGFREKDFFPRGTPEGIAGATPPGMRAMILDATGLRGVHALPAGARVDLMANIPLSELASFDVGHRSTLSTGARLKQGDKKGEDTKPIMLAQRALVLRPVYERAKPESNNAAKRSKKPPVHEIALAVNPEDVILVQIALNKELDVTCVAHSMQRSGEPAASTPRRPQGPVAPVTSRSILAYEAITYDYFEDVATRQIRHESVTPDEIERHGVITSLEQLVGAVVKHDIPKGSFITQADLLQPVQAKTRDNEGVDRGSFHEASKKDGSIRLVAHSEATTDAQQAERRNATPADVRRGRPNIVGEVPGISKFVPPGYVAIAIPWNRLYGAEHLKIGDVVDLSPSYSLRYKVTENETERRPDGSVVASTTTRRASEPTKRTYDESLGFRAETWFAALNARVIGPVGFPPPTEAARYLGDTLFQTLESDDSVAHTGPPIMFAIAERDQEAVAAALATDFATFTVAIQPLNRDAETPAGWKRVVLAPDGLPAFERVDYTKLHQGHTRRLLTRLVRVDDPVFENALTEAELRPLLGRVLRAYKDRHAFFTAKDFYSKEVQPGLAAGIEKGSTIYVADDGDIEGLKHFQDNDRIAILYRAVVEPPEGVIAHGLNLERPIASVVVPEARVVRASQEGKTVLAIPERDVTRLHATWAAAFTKEKDQSEEGKNQRLHLVAISLPAQSHAGSVAQAALPAAEVKPAAASAARIPDFDPVAQARVLEVIVGGRRETHVFSGDNSATRDSL